MSFSIFGTLPHSHSWICVPPSEEMQQETQAIDLSNRDATSPNMPHLSRRSASTAQQGAPAKSLASSHLDQAMFPTHGTAFVDSFWHSTRKNSEDAVQRLCPLPPQCPEFTLVWRPFSDAICSQTQTVQAEQGSQDGILRHSEGRLKQELSTHTPERCIRLFAVYW